MLGKKCSTIHDGIALSKATIDDGRAYRKFLDLVKRQGGDPEAIENLESYPISKHAIDVTTLEEGYVGAVDAFELGRSTIQLGAGRDSLNDTIDPKAGIVLQKKVGDRVGMGDVLARIYSDRETVLEEVRARVKNAYRIQSTEPDRIHMILNLITDEGLEPWIEQ
jgi:pyrimidine-nucleoside phosphorylase